MKRCAMVVLVAAIAVSGCARMKSWSYAPEPRRSSAPLVDKTLVVLPFEDRRPNVNSNYLLLYLIPLFPCGWANYGTPEGVPMHMNSGQWQFRPPDDLARAVAQEVENRRVFRETFVGNRPSEGDLVLSGTIVSTKYKATMFTYGLSVYGPLLWLVGLPSGTSSNTLELGLRIAKTPSDPPLWACTIREHASDVSWIYWLKPDFRYDELLKRGMGGALESLSGAAPKLR